MKAHLYIHYSVNCHWSIWKYYIHTISTTILAKQRTLAWSAWTCTWIIRHGLVCLPASSFTWFLETCICKNLIQATPKLNLYELQTCHHLTGTFTCSMCLLDCFCEVFVLSRLFHTSCSLAPGQLSGQRRDKYVLYLPSL